MDKCLPFLKLFSHIRKFGALFQVKIKDWYLPVITGRLKQRNITQLTKKQEQGIIEWREHCLKIGRDTSPINKPIVESSWKKFYKILNIL